MSRRASLAMAVAGLAAVVAVVAGLRGVDAPNALAGGVAGVLLLGATWLGLRRTAVELDPAEAAPERGGDAAVPGDAFDAELAGERGRALDRSSFTRDRIRTRLRALARRLLVARRGLTEAEAECRLDAGDWTSDDAAASFLRGDGPAPTLRTRLTGGDGFVRGVRASVRALADDVGAPARSRRERAGWVEDAERAPAGEGTDEAAGGTAVRSTGHWTGIGALALASLGVGVAAGAPGIALGGVVAVGYLAVAGTAPPDPSAVAVERDVAETPAPGERATVRVTVRNEGDGHLPDVRVVDGVPAALLVVDGSPRHATALAPGATDSFEYAVRARRGVHAFDPVTVRTRNPTDGAERATTVAVDTALDCRLRPAPAGGRGLGGTAGRFVGTTPSTTGGPGVEFHSTRAYRRGDPARRVDWNRLARTGELTTVDYQEDRATTVVLVVDARATARVAPGPDGETALDRSVDAAGALAGDLLAAGNRVGLAAFCPAPLWVDPAATRTTEHRLLTLLTEHAAFAPATPDGEVYAADWVDRFRAWVEGPATVILCSPLVDDTAVALVDRLRRAGHPVTVCSPDATAADTVGHTVAGLERRVRLSALRADGTRVVDWDADATLSTALARARRRWSP
jgi:uncharacterized protein (DUF58 family)